MLTKSRSAVVFAYAAGLMYLIPIFWMVITSLKRERDLFASPPSLIPNPISFSSYTSVALVDPAIWTGIRNSAIISAGVILLTLCLGLPASYAISRYRLRMVPVFLLLFLVVEMIPPVNLALPLFSLFSDVGLVNTYLSLIIANTSLALPLGVVILYPFFASLPSVIFDAAMVDGCNHFQAFYRIAVPVIRPAIIALATITLVGTWGEYVFALSLATSPDIEPVTITLANLAYYQGAKWNNLMAVAVVVSIPVVAIFVIFQKHIVQGLLAGSVK